MKDSAQLIVSHQAEFKEIFGIDLHMFMSQTGFDVVAFDDQFVQPGKDESMADKIKREHGERAVELICDLIHWRT